MPQLNPEFFATQVIWLAIVFIGLYWLMKSWLVPSIGSVLDARSGRISGDVDEAKRLKDETSRAIANYEKALADARSKAGVLAQGERDRLKAEIDAERAKVDAQLSGRIADAEAQIKDAKNTAMGQVHGIAGDTVETIVQELLGIKIDKQEALDAVARARANS